jgi:antitoxin CcdA
MARRPAAVGLTLLAKMRMMDAHQCPYTNAHGGTAMPRARSPAKRPANVSVRSDLLDAAREAGLNLSATLESALERELAEAKAKKWRENNREAIAAYNEHVETHGAFSDGVRSF